MLVRHAMPVQDPDVDPARWRLSPEGVAAARAVGPLVPADAVLVSSDEPKAYDTVVTATGLPVAPDPRLREVARPLEPYAGDWRAARLAYLTGRPPEGWEPADEVAARIEAAVGEWTAAGRPLVLGGHGMAFTVWLAARRLIDDPAAFWSGLRLPDVVSITDGNLSRPAVNPRH